MPIGMDKDNPIFKPEDCWAYPLPGQPLVPKPYEPEAVTLVIENVWDNQTVVAVFSGENHAEYAAAYHAAIDPYGSIYETQTLEVSPWEPGDDVP